MRSDPQATELREIVEQRKAEDACLRTKRCLGLIPLGLGFVQVETVDSAEVAVIAVQHPIHVEVRHCCVAESDSHRRPSVLLRDQSRSSRHRQE